MEFKPSKHNVFKIWWKAAKLRQRPIPAETKCTGAAGNSNRLTWNIIPSVCDFIGRPFKEWWLPYYELTHQNGSAAHTRKGHLMINTADSVRGFISCCLQLDTGSIWPTTIDSVPPYPGFSWWNEARPFCKEQVSAGLPRRGKVEENSGHQYSCGCLSNWQFFLFYSFLFYIKTWNILNGQTWMNDRVWRYSSQCCAWTSSESVT